MFIIPFFGLLGVAPKKVAGDAWASSPPSAWSRSGWSATCWSCRRSPPLPGPGVRAARGWAPTLLFVGLYLLSYALFARTFPMISPRLAEITLDRERGHACSWRPSSTTRKDPRDYVPAELLERGSQAAVDKRSGARRTKHDAAPAVLDTGGFLLRHPAHRLRFLVPAHAFTCSASPRSAGGSSPGGCRTEARR